MRDPALLQRMRIAARADFEDRFSIEFRNRVLSGLYRSITNATLAHPAVGQAAPSDAVARGADDGGGHLGCVPQVPAARPESVA